MHGEEKDLEGDSRRKGEITTKDPDKGGQDEER
jgi:hypothetical protein